MTSRGGLGSRWRGWVWRITWRNRLAEMELLERSVGDVGGARKKLKME
jgi:hypothetical protein